MTTANGESQKGACSRLLICNSSLFHFPGSHLIRINNVIDLSVGDNEDTRHVDRKVLQKLTKRRILPVYFQQPEARVVHAVQRVDPGEDDVLRPGSDSTDSAGLGELKLPGPEEPGQRAGGAAALQPPGELLPISC